MQAGGPIRPLARRLEVVGRLRQATDLTVGLCGSRGLLQTQVALRDLGQLARVLEQRQGTLDLTLGQAQLRRLLVFPGLDQAAHTRVDALGGRRCALAPRSPRTRREQGAEQEGDPDECDVHGEHPELAHGLTRSLWSELSTPALPVYRARICTSAPRAPRSFGLWHAGV